MSSTWLFFPKQVSMKNYYMIFQNIMLDIGLLCHKIKHKINYLIPKEWYHLLNIMKLETQRLQPTYSPPQNLKWLISRNSFFTFSYLENEIQHQIKRIENSKRTLCFIICCTKCHTKVVKLLQKYIIYTYSPAYAHFGLWKVGVSGIVLIFQLMQKCSTYAYIS